VRKIDYASAFEGGAEEQRASIEIPRRSHRSRVSIIARRMLAYKHALRFVRAPRAHLVSPSIGLCVLTGAAAQSSGTHTWAHTLRALHGTRLGLRRGSKRESNREKEREREREKEEGGGRCGK